MAKQWCNYASSVTLLTTSNANLLQKDDFGILPSLNRIELDTKDYRTSRAIRSDGKIHFEESEKQSLMARSAIKAINSFPLLPYLGEGGKKYINEGFRQGSAFLKKNPEAIIYSSFRPYADHLIACRLKKKFPKTTWIADFRDLHLDPLYKQYYWEAYQKRTNRKILKSADLVLTVSKGLANSLKALCPNVHVLRNGIPKPEPSTQTFKKFTICYTGSLFKEERDPTPLLQCIQQNLDQNIWEASKLQFMYAGKDQATMSKWIQQHNLDDIFNTKGELSRKEALELQRSAHINVLLSSSQSGYQGVLTGKFFEYLAAANPILLLLKGDHDEEFEEIFKENNLGYIHTSQQSNKDDLNHFLNSKWDEWLSNGETVKLDEDLIQANFSWESSFKKMITQINKTSLA